MSFLDKFKFKKKPFKDLKETEEKKVPVVSDVKKTVKAVKKISSKKTDKKIPDKKPEDAKKSKKEDTGDAYKVLIKPIISEKVTNLGAINQYVFEISPRAGKNEVKKAVKSLYNVMPIKVRIINITGKKVRFGKTEGVLKNKRKAVITLKEGETIQVYEGI